MQFIGHLLLTSSPWFLYRPKTFGGTHLSARILGDGPTHFFPPPGSKDMLDLVFIFYFKTTLDK